MSRQDLFYRCLAMIDLAALDDDRWPEAANLIHEVCRVDGTGIMFGEGQSRKDTSVFFARMCMHDERREDAERAYFNKYFFLDERVPRIRQLPAGQLVHDLDLYTEKDRKTSRTYNEFLVPNRIANSLFVRMDGPQGSRIVLNIGGPTDKEGWNSDQKEIIEKLLPHLVQFIRIRQELFDAGALQSSLDQILDKARCGVIQLNWRGQIVEMNKSARELFEQGSGLLSRSGYLGAVKREDNVKLRKLLDRALPGLGNRGISGSVTIGRVSVAPRLLVHAIPVGEGQRDSELSRVAVLVLVVDPASKAAIDPAVVAAAFDLTPSESHVASLLAEGNSIREISQITRREESTVRWHIKHIFNKHNITRQSELIRRVLELARLHL